jgi:hypothetical protein
MNGNRLISLQAGLFHCLALAVALALAGCAVHIKDERMVDGFSYSAEKEAAQGEVNFAILRKKYGPEWELNKGDPQAPPVLGLAMSGGGMRSAAFNIGVLKGLHEVGILRKIDLMSSVSGGGYALSWYYLQKFNSGEADAAIFDPCGRFQKHLEENGQIITHSDLFLVEFPEYLIKLGINVIAMPFHWLANGVFDWHLNLAPYRWFYQNAIEREFHLTPSADQSDFVNDYSAAGFVVGVKEPVGFEAMRAFIKEKKLPAFIINTTATISDNIDHYGADYANSIFEFTPFSYGSDAYGYHAEDFPIDISTAVAVSGAAADSSILPAKMGFVLSALNSDLGYNIPNYNISDPRKVAGHNVLPFPFYLAYRSNDDIRGTSIYLTDGGHSENLGAFALIRRMCKNIIIVDAEYDPHYRFEGYRKLKARLKKELRVDFSLPLIDEGLRVKSLDFEGNEALFDNECPEKLAKEIGFSTDAKVHYDEEIKLWTLTDRKAGGKTYLAKKEADKLNIYTLYDGSPPVMKGSIGQFPLMVGDTVEKVTIDVTYIKLSLDLNRLDTYPPSVTRYYKAPKNWFKELTGFQNSPFPHEDTSDISYSKRQFSAYRDLGYHIVTNYYGRPSDRPLPNKVHSNDANCPPAE